MSSLLFLPIDIDMSAVDFTQFDKSVKLTAYNPYWESTQITKDTVLKNGFDKILNQLPFTSISVLTYKIQQSVVNSHVDVYPSMNFKDGELDISVLDEPLLYDFVDLSYLGKLESDPKYYTTVRPVVPAIVPPELAEEPLELEEK
jgi:hypothetical protein